LIPWVLATTVFDGTDGSGRRIWHWEYWRGSMGFKGPSRSRYMCEALKFATAQEARAAAGITAGMANSSRWRPLEITPHGELSRHLVESPFMRDEPELADLFETAST
jgi:hypothetical protein